MLSLPSGTSFHRGDDLFAIVENVAGAAPKRPNWNAIRKYIDIQLVLEEDRDGWKPLAIARSPVSDYSAGRRTPLFPRCAIQWIATPPGTFCSFLPGDMRTRAGERGTDSQG